MTRATLPYQHLQNTVLGEPVYDALGKEVQIGDLIAIGVRKGDRGDLVLGRVTGFSTRKESMNAVVRKHEPEFAASNNWSPQGTYPRTREYTPPSFDRAVTVQVTYEDPLGGSIWTAKGYTTAYNRRFAIIEGA